MMKKILLSALFLCFLIPPVYGAVTFDATTTKIDVGSATGLDDLELQSGGGISVSAWIYANSNGEGNAGQIFNKANWAFRILNSQKLRFTHSCSSASIIRDTTTTFTLNAWHHVVMTWPDGTSASPTNFWLDGVQMSEDSASSQNCSGTKTSDASSNGIIGNNSGQTNTFDGYITEVAVWDAVLSNTDIQRLYSGGSPAKYLPLSVNPAELRGYWPMDDFDNGVTVTTEQGIRDMSGLQNKGTPTSAVGYTEPLTYKTTIYNGGLKNAVIH